MVREYKSYVFGKTWGRVNYENFSSRVNCSLNMAFIKMREMNWEIQRESDIFCFFIWRSCNCPGKHVAVFSMSRQRHMNICSGFPWAPLSSPEVGIPAQVKFLTYERHDWWKHCSFFPSISAKELTRLYGSWNALINTPVAGLAACHLPRGQM